MQDAIYFCPMKSNGKPSHKLCCLTLLLAAALLSGCGKPEKTPAGPDPGSEDPRPARDFSKIYVSPSGQDSADGTLEAPLQSLGKALSLAKEGSTVYMRGGTYRERVRVSVSGREGSPVTITACPGEIPVLDGGNGSGWSQDWNGFALVFQYDKTNASLPAISTEEGLLVIDGASHIVISGITVTGSPSAGIYCKRGSSHISVSDCTISDCVAPGICFGAEGSASSDIKVTGNIVKNCAQRSREAISLRTVDGFEIAYNTVEEVIKESIDAKSGCSNGSIHHNRIIRGGHCGIYLDAGFTEGRPAQSNISVFCNEIIDPLGTGICVSSEAGNDCSGISIYNNLVYTTGRYQSGSSLARYYGNGNGIKVGVCSDDMRGLIKDVVIFHNTVLGLRQQGIYVNYPNVENIVIANNISAWHDLDPAGTSSRYGLDPARVKFISNLVHASGQSNAAGHIIADPGLSDPLMGNLKLTRESPAVDAADAGYAAESDFAGHKRPNGKACDIGAYEFIL